MLQYTEHGTAGELRSLGKEERDVTDLVAVTGFARQPTVFDVREPRSQRGRAHRVRQHRARVCLPHARNRRVPARSLVGARNSQQLIPRGGVRVKVRQ